MSINFHDGSIIADFDYKSITGNKGLGFYRLNFLFSFYIPPWKDDVLKFEDIKAEVTCGANTNSQILIGNAEPSRPLSIISKELPSNHMVNFYLDVTKETTNAIENLRDGSDLIFNIKIYGNTYKNNQRWYGEDKKTVTVNQNDWINVLKQIEFSDFLLFEIPIPKTTKESELSNAITCLKKSKEFFLLGHYDECVASCRKAIESLNKGLDQEKHIQASKILFKDNRNEMSIDQRIYFLRESLKNCTHLAHHVSESGKQFVFNRETASLILTITATFFTHEKSKLLAK